MQHSSFPVWIPSAEAGQLQDNEIHVWQVALADADCHVEWFDAVERRRLEQSAHQRGRDLFCASRSMLRHLLAGYLDAQPGEVKLEIEPGGKPIVRGQALHFNLSHARDTLLLAFCRNHPLGIDLEYPRPLKNLAQMAQRIFNAQELQALQAEDDPQERFFQYWTRFEATQKCAGQGIFGAREAGETVQHLGFSVGPARACVAWQPVDTRPNGPSLRYFSYAGNK